jgi:D-glycero-D-manno-heptose 1,7-bisphosphate phosphatase
MLQCVILAGGLGTRLGALTADTPKPMLPVAGRPFLEHLIGEVSRFGIVRFIILAGYRGDAVSTHFSRPFQGPDGTPISIRVMREPEPLGTAGGLKFFADCLDERFLVMNGDSYLDFNILRLVFPALDTGSAIRIAVRRDENPGRYGSVRISGKRVVHFAEKRSGGAPGLINAGIYLVTRDILSLIEHTPCSMETDVIPRLVAAGKVEAQPFDGAFIDIGIPSEYERAQNFFPIRRGAVFFDRDGVLNEDSGYTYRIEDLRWLPGAREAICAVNDSGRFAFVVTNQAGIARGHYDENAVNRFHAAMQAQLALLGAHVDAFAFCPHHPDGIVPEYAHPCACRKPAPGMINELLRHWPVNTKDAVMIGDKASDLAAATAARIEGRLYRGGDLCRFV